ncbi:ImmA/IrrE family metallo-endopeptidase, partial [Candidatus Woesebacteria bacterium]|nr:ImmA/IrrE family metallo-endopeptidase [Candidatus Woesebacteria bacterium]
LSANTSHISNIRERLSILASYQGVISIKYPDMNESESGKLIAKDGNRYEILVNGRHSSTRQNFTLAHEICHTFFKGPSEIGGYFCEDSHEEKLCDIGASEIIYSNENFNDMPFTISTLTEVSTKLNVSYEATAIKMVKSGKWANVGLILWKKKLKMHQNLEQAAFWKEYEDKEVYRVHYSFFNNDIYIPQNKSVNIGNIIDVASTGIISKGIIQLNLMPVHSISLEAISIYKNMVLSLASNVNILSLKPKKNKKEIEKGNLF